MTQVQSLTGILLDFVPADGSSIGNQSLFQKFVDAASRAGHQITEADFEHTKASLIAAGVLAKGKGRGGSVLRVDPQAESFDLSVQSALAQNTSTPKKVTKNTKVQGKATTPASAAQIISYRHPDKRKNNPEVGMVTPDTDPEAGKTRWAYDPHIDPDLQFDPQRAAIETLIDEAIASNDPEQMRLALAELKRLQSPYLNWAGKAERTSFDVDTVSLHVHERIDPASILAAVRKAMKDEGKSQGHQQGDPARPVRRPL